jgi:hypothetical protein
MFGLLLLLLGSTTLLSGCASAPSVPQVPVSIPSLDKPPQHVLEHNFIERMESFLSGKLPSQKQSEPDTSSASPSTKK